MVIVKNHIATDPDSGISCVVLDLADGVYPSMIIVRKGVKPPPGYVCKRGHRAPSDLVNPQPMAVRGFNHLRG